MRDRPSMPPTIQNALSRFTHLKVFRFFVVFSAFLMLSCAFLDNLATQIASTPSEPSETRAPPETEEGATIPPASTEMSEPSPIPSTETREPSPVTPTVTPTVDVWQRISGTWSGCLASNPTSGINDLVTCTEPRGNFVTLYLLTDCDLDQHCGNYVKGTFDSEYILFKLMLNGRQYPQVQMYGDAGTGMFSWASTDLVVERSGDTVIITEASGEGYVLLPGCDPIIQQNVTVGCFEQLQ